MLVKRKTVSSRLCEPWKENGSMYARFYLFFGSIQSVLGFGETVSVFMLFDRATKVPQATD